MRGIFNTIIFFFFATIILWASCQEDAPKQTPAFEPYNKVYQFHFNTKSAGGIECDSGRLAYFTSGLDYRFIDYKSFISDGVKVYDIYYNKRQDPITRLIAQKNDYGTIKIQDNKIHIKRSTDTLTITLEKRISFFGFDNNGCAEVFEVKQ